MVKKYTTGRLWYDCEEHLAKRMNKEVKYEGLKKESGQSTDSVIQFLMVGSKNHKLSKAQRITKQDLERQDKLGQILRDYQAFIDQMKRDLRKDDDKRWIRSNQIYEVRQDMKESKEILLGVFGREANPVESTVYDFSFLDFKNPTHVRQLIEVKMEFDPNRELSFVVMDLNDIMLQVLTDEELIIVECLRDRVQIKDIAAMFDMTYKQAQYAIAKIAKKIVKYAKEIGA